MQKYEWFFVNTWEMFEKLKTYSSKIKANYFKFDVETDSANEKTALLYGVGFSFLDSKVFYLCWRDKPAEGEAQGNIIWTSEQQKEIIQWFYENSSSRKIITHNGVFDCLVIENNWEIDISPYLYHDTILSAHTLAEDGPFALKELGTMYVDESAKDEQTELKESVLANGGTWNKINKEMFKANPEILGKYCCQDVYLTSMLFHKFEKELKEQGLDKLFYEEESMPLYQVTIDMKRKGVHINKPHYEKLAADIKREQLQLEFDINNEIKEEIKPFLIEVLNKKVPIKSGGVFPKTLAEILNIPLPVKTTKKKGIEVVATTLAAKEVEAMLQKHPEHSNFYNWILDKEELKVPAEVLYKAQEKIFLEKEECKYVFNINSSDHLAYYFFEIKKYKTDKKTPGGKYKVDANFIDELTADDPTAQKIIDYKKLQKMLSTYVEGILDRETNGKIHTSMLQHGTTSGRYASRNPNLQNQPRVKEEDSGLSPTVLKYVNSIREGFVPKPGHKFLDTDYESLEIVCFSHVSGEPALREVFNNGEDFYSKVAIGVLKLDKEYSANKKAENFLKKHRLDLRQKFKPVPLGLTYGMENKRLQDTIGCDQKEAVKIIADFFKAYPELKKYMISCDLSAKKNGYVKNQFGRVRHLPEVKQMYDRYGDSLLDWRWAKSRNLLPERRSYKQGLNNAKNFPIQSLAAAIINRASIEIYKEFKARNLDAYIVLQVHDQLIVSCNENQIEEARNIIRDKMENTVKLSIKLTAEPAVGNNLKESH